MNLQERIDNYVAETKYPRSLFLSEDGRLVGFASFRSSSAFLLDISQFKYNLVTQEELMLQKLRLLLCRRATTQEWALLNKLHTNMGW